MKPVPLATLAACLSSLSLVSAGDPPKPKPPATPVIVSAQQIPAPDAFPAPTQTKRWAVKVNGKHLAWYTSEADADKAVSDTEKQPGNKKKKLKVTKDGPVIKETSGDVQAEMAARRKQLAKDHPGDQAILDQFDAWLDRYYPEAGLLWGCQVSAEFRKKVRGIAKDLGVDPNDLMGIMAFESGETFRSDKQNEGGSHAYGLVQFMDDAVTDMQRYVRKQTGDKTFTLTLDQLKAMTPEDQLDYVKVYFQMRADAHGGSLSGLEDLYMSVLNPSFVGKKNSDVLWVQGAKGASGRNYDANAGLDTDGDGKITKGEAAGLVRQRMEARKKKPVDCGS